MEGRSKSGFLFYVVLPKNLIFARFITLIPEK
jgi:hypothetical protein